MTRAMSNKPIIKLFVNFQRYFGSFWQLQGQDRLVTVGYPNSNCKVVPPHKNMNTLKLFRSYLASLMLTNALHVLMQQETMCVETESSIKQGLAPCLDARLELKNFHSLSITSTFAHMYEVLNID
jgi:ubiquinone biosynthesis protein COQ9